MSIQTLASIFNNASNKPAVTNTSHHDSPVTLSYQQLQSQIYKFGDQLLSYTQLNVEDRVTLLSDNSIEFVIAFLGITNIRNVACPLNPKFTASELEFYLKDSNSKVIIIHQNLLKGNQAIINLSQKLNIPLLILSLNNDGILLTANNNNKSIQHGIAKKIIPKPDDIALLLHTSGTTGKPKAVPLSHKNITTTMKNIINTYQLTTKDSSLIVMPLFHVHGLIGALLSTLLSSGHAVIPPRFSAKTFWDDYTHFNCTWYSAVPTIHQILLNIPLPTNLPKIRFIRSCSSSLAPQTFHDLEARFKAPVLEAYAMTEAAHQMTSNPLPPNKRKPGSVGKPQGVLIKILDQQDNEVEEGEVCISGLNVTKGYINNIKANKESFTKQGFFRTGDQGKFDKDGYLFLTGRIKELINRGGEKISPLEVDAVLLAHPRVAEAVCFAVPDKKYGQEVHAAIRVKGDKLSQEELIQHCKKHLVDFKIPKKFYFTDALPKTATGKIQRRKMVDHFLPKSKL